MSEKTSAPGGEVLEGVAKSFLRDNLEMVLFAVVLILFFKTFVGQQFTIPSPSMRNTLLIGDHVLVNKFLFAKPQWAWEAKLFPMRAAARGDIIVFRYPGDTNQDWVKRCVAVPGDTLQVKDKRLFVNGRQVTGAWEHHDLAAGEEPVAGPWPATRSPGPLEHPFGYWPFLEPGFHYGPPVGGFRDELGPVTVPAGHVFAMGDNRDHSGDSRYWGFLPMDHLRGRPFLIWWSFREGGRDDQNAKVPRNPLDVALNVLDGARHFLVWTRWERTGTIPE